ncbi:hypothetical protein PR048_029208 [Dryococelus australis]|uniref:Uncharacterized protein n=1 Tax=Dryococelus australis TaxID=614101 RepID=A0ABQ9GFF6_9NEOP|nr:hypothetical protein PR048_029208 [Dryococelus australis]
MHTRRYVLGSHRAGTALSLYSLAVSPPEDQEELFCSLHREHPVDEKSERHTCAPTMPALSLGRSVWDHGLFDQGLTVLRSAEKLNLGRGVLVVRLLASQPCEPSSIPVSGSLPVFRMCASCRTVSLVGVLSRGFTASAALAFRCCSTLTSLHLHRLSRPHSFEPPKYFHSLTTAVPTLDVKLRVVLLDWPAERKRCSSGVAICLWALTSRSEEDLPGASDRSMAALSHFTLQTDSSSDDQILVRLANPPTTLGATYVVTYFCPRWFPCLVNKIPEDDVYQEQIKLMSLFKLSATIGHTDRAALRRTCANVSGLMSSSLVSRGVAYTVDLMWPHSQKSGGVMSGERGGHAMGPPLLSTGSGSACRGAGEPQWRHEVEPRPAETTLPHEHVLQEL